jgi:bacteriocin biosynthesis cyclodehydratase domain-containing protein
MDSPALRAHLAPGLRVVRRGLDHLQVGLYDGRRVLLPRTDDVERTLALLLQRQPLDEDPATEWVLDRLDRHGCLAWAQPSGQARGRVAVQGGFDLHGLPDLDHLLGALGVAITPRTSDADVVLVLSAGELSRDLLDPLLRSRASHVVVRLVDGGAVLGPFVVPGVTACLRCIDAHRCVCDPDHVAVTTRYVRASTRARPDGVADIADPALVAVALAWVARDVVAHLEGREPSTWSRTLSLGADPARRHEHTWLRHPQCGCSWSAG